MYFFYQTKQNNNMKTKYIILYILIILLVFSPIKTTLAVDGEKTDSYIVYNQDNEIIMEKSQVEVGDTFITANFEEYEIYLIEGNKAYAQKKGNVNIPISKEFKSNNFSTLSNNQQTICLYMTHNDESYTPTDGYDSIYGAGGIHDVAKMLKSQLESKNYNVVLDETLHIPHNSSAYSRSGLTATKLFNSYNPDALFDIHRDGVSKSYYYTNQNGENLSKVRIVVGKSNPNYQNNYQFAKTLFATGNAMYPWLFSDIYSGSGHYNQALKDTCLLFEMGTYLIEKEYVYNSIPYLVDAIDSVLYTPIEDDTLLPNEDEQSPNEQTPQLPGNSTDDNLQNSQNTTQQPETKNNWILAIIFSGVIIISLTIGGIILYKKSKKEKSKKDKN